MNMAYQNIDRSANKIVVVDPKAAIPVDSTRMAAKDTVSTSVDTPKPMEQTPKQAAPAQKSSPKYHTVKKGDTLYAIARKYHTTVDKLCKINHIKETSILSLGQKIKLK